MKETFLHLASQAGKAVFSVHTQSRPVVGELSAAIEFKVFDCQILPILEYASDIWYTCDSVNDLEKINLKFIKSTLGESKHPERSVLELTGLDQAWETQQIGNTNKFMLSFKDSIVRIFKQRWRQDIESSRKLRTYSLVITYLCVEPYILNIKGSSS